MAVVAVHDSVDDLFEDPARLILAEARAALAAGHGVDVFQQISPQRQLQNQVEPQRGAEHVIQLDLRPGKQP